MAKCVIARKSVASNNRTRFTATEPNSLLANVKKVDVAAQRIDVPNAASPPIVSGKKLHRYTFSRD